MTGWKTVVWWKRILPCWPFLHDWTEWKHDDHYNKNADMQVRSCSRQRWYSNRRRKWMGGTHFQRKWEGMIQ